MAENIEITQDDLKQAEALESSLRGTGAEAAAIDICATWARIKPYWSWIIAAVRRIPRIGEAIANALTILGRFLDAHCAKA